MIIMLRYSRAPPCAKRVSGSMATYYDRAHKVDNLKSAVLRRIVGQAEIDEVADSLRSGWLTTVKGHHLLLSVFSIYSFCLCSCHSCLFSEEPHVHRSKTSIIIE